MEVKNRAVVRKIFLNFVLWCLYPVQLLDWFRILDETVLQGNMTSPTSVGFQLFESEYSKSNTLLEIVNRDLLFICSFK